MRNRTILVTCLYCIGACSSGSDDVLEPPPAGPGLSADQVLGKSEIGSGIIGPNRIVHWLDDTSRLLIATGKGESFGNSFLYQVDAASMVQLAGPLSVGRNASDVAWVGDKVLVTARSSRELSVVDPEAWEVVGRLALDFSPISIAAVDDTTAAVSSTDSDSSVILVRLEAGGTDARIVERRQLGDFARDLTFDAARGAIHAIGPGIGIVSLDAATLATRSATGVDGRLSFGSAMWHGNLLVTDRDGFLHRWNPDSGALTSIDLANALGLDRNEVPLRGIDPIDVVPLGTKYVAVMNQRQNSILFSQGTMNSEQLVPVAEFTKAAFGIAAPDTNEIIWAESVTDRIRKVRIPSNVSESGLEVVEFDIGTRVADAVPLTGASTGLLAVLDSEGNLTVVDKETNLVGDLSAGNGRWRGPIAPGPEGSVLAISAGSGDGESVWMLDVSGVRRAEYPLEVSPVFSITATDSSALVTARITAEVQVVEFTTGLSSTLDLRRSRPRIGIMLGAQDALVFHDTQPDIGITRLSNGAEAGFRSLEFDQWWSDAYRDSELAVASTFAGALAQLTADAQLMDSLRINFRGVKHIAPGQQPGTSWIVSEDQNAALAVSLTDRSIDRRLDIDGLFKIYEFDPGRVWLVTLRDILALEY